MNQLRWSLHPSALTGLALVLALPLACSKDDRGAAEQLVAPSAPGAGAPSGVPNVTRAPDPAAMLIRTATASVEVEKLDPAIDAARTAAARFGGIVANARVESGRSERPRAALQIKVPAARFDSLLKALAPLGRVESIAVTAEDVGQEYVDVEARLTNLRRLEARIIDLLANRTGKLADVLTAEHELARVRGDIEQIEGRKRYLERSTAVSTLELTLHEPAPLIGGGSNPIGGAFRESWRNLVAVIAWCIRALGVIVPAAAFAVLLLIGGRWGKRWLLRSGLLGAD